MWFFVYQLNRLPKAWVSHENWPAATQAACEEREADSERGSSGEDRMDEDYRLPTSSKNTFLYSLVFLSCVCIPR